MQKSALALLLLVCLIFGSFSTVSAAFVDIDGNWARESIRRLDDQGIFNGIIEGNFMPNDPILREELIELAARSFNLEQTHKQNLYSWLEHFLPMEDSMEEIEPTGDYLTRGELAALTANVLGLTDNQLVPGDWYPSFEDVNKEHPAFLHIEILNRLSILPTYVLNRFEPSRLATRAEVASLIDSALRLGRVEGQVSEILDSANRIIVTTSAGEVQSLPLQPDSVLYFGSQIGPKDNLEVGDTLTALYDKNGNVRLVTVENRAISPDLLNGIANLTQNISEVLSPDQIASIVSGDWGGLNDSVRYELYQEMVERGVAPWEAEALLDRNWGSVQEMAKERLVNEASDYLKIAPELFYSALNQDWTRLLEYAQVEVAQRLLTGSILNP